MLPEFERAAFAMRAGDLSSTPVRTQVGYHIISVYDYEPLFTNALAQVYPNVSSDAAEEKADSLAGMRADSLLRTLKSPAQARAAAQRLGLTVISYEHVIGQRENAPGDVLPYFRKLETGKAGQLLSGTQKFHGMGYAVTWVDSLSPPRLPTWEEARDKAVEAYRRGTGQRAMDGKLAELDSLLQAGWSIDSLAAGWGGLLSTDNYSTGGRIIGIGSSGRLDSLIFGAQGVEALPPGRLSEWTLLPGGAVRLRVKELRAPDANAIAIRVANERRAETERSLLGYFEALKKRYPVRILDRQLRDVALPKPPPGSP
jgi:hypothetical protein